MNRLMAFACCYDLSDSVWSKCDEAAFVSLVTAFDSEDDALDEAFRILSGVLTNVSLGALLCLALSTLVRFFPLDIDGFVAGS